MLLVVLSLTTALVKEAFGGKDWALQCLMCHKWLLKPIAGVADWKEGLGGTAGDLFSSAVEWLPVSSCRRGMCNACSCRVRRAKERAVSNHGASLPSPLSDERIAMGVVGVRVSPVNAIETGRPQPSHVVHVRAAAVVHDPSPARSPCPSVRAHSPLAPADWLPESPSLLS